MGNCNAGERAAKRHIQTVTDRKLHIHFVNENLPEITVFDSRHGNEANRNGKTEAAGKKPPEQLFLSQPATGWNVQINR
ncbi:hypothetical protein RB195_009998 [Necator americanus]|uniref:Uncharacterized protein n=1 Tax=Necator americanus TaxID=51031 RepID=A0ABR1CVW2_NECAM